MKRAVIAIALAACSKAEPPSPTSSPPIVLPAAEVHRAEDACKSYVAKACACAAAKSQCELARALPETVRLALETAGNPETKHDDALRAQQAVRETEKECIEQMARLPALGCP
jgi:hypothetical protein